MFPVFDCVIFLPRIGIKGFFICFVGHVISEYGHETSSSGQWFFPRKFIISTYFLSLYRGGMKI